MAYSLPSLRQNNNSAEQIVALPHCIIVLPLPFMEVKSTEYLISSPDVESCPKGTLPEVAFIGRSNVGKSSLINMLSNKKELAKVTEINARESKVIEIERSISENEGKVSKLETDILSKKSDIERIEGRIRDSEVRVKEAQKVVETALGDLERLKSARAKL
jgi:replication-associated recombination protein RarA